MELLLTASKISYFAVNSDWFFLFNKDLRSNYEVIITLGVISRELSIYPVQFLNSFINKLITSVCVRL